MRVLLTCFDAFGGAQLNASFEAVQLVPDHIHGAEIIKITVPTIFQQSLTCIAEAMDIHQPDIVLSIGVGRCALGIEIERVGINWTDARIPDNAGQQPIDEPIRVDGPCAYFSTLPIKAMVDSIQAVDIPVYVSYTAGTFVCNQVLYGVLDMIAQSQKNIRAAFIHVPCLPEQATDEAEVLSLSAVTSARAIEIAISTAVQTRVDVKSLGGTLS